MSLPPVILLGSLSLDHLLTFRGSYHDLIPPRSLGSLSLSVLLDTYTTSRGGVGANIAYNLALLGDHPVLLTSVGEDGEDYLSSLTNLGVDTTHVVRSHLPTSTFTVITDSKSCQVGGFYPGAMSDSSKLTLAPWYALDPLVVVSAYDPATMSRLVVQSRTHNLRLLYDVGQQVSNLSQTDLSLGLDSAHILLLNEYELGVLCQKTGQTEATLKSKVSVVITTLGAQGSIIEGSTVPHPVQIKAVQGLKAVDPTGAGDAYRAGLIYGLSRGLDLAECARLGSITGSFAVEHRGTQSHRFTLAKVKARYYDTYGYALRLQG